MGSIGGVEVVWQALNPAQAPLLAAGQGGFNEWTRTRWDGTASTTISASALDAAPGNYERMRGLLGLLRHVGFVLAVHDEGVWLDESYAWLRPSAPATERGPHHTILDASGSIEGSPASHVLGVVQTATGRANAFNEGGVTALHVPTALSPTGEVVDDASRGVVQTPSAWSDLDAGYSPGEAVRNGLSPVLVDANADPDALYDDVVHALTGGIRAWGADDYRDSTLRAPGVDVAFDGAAGTVTFTDRIHGLGSLVFDIGAYEGASTPGQGLYAGPHRFHVVTSHGWRVAVDDGSNAWLEPPGGVTSFTLNGGGASRSTGTGVYYHEVATDKFLVSDSDWSMSAGGVIADYAEGARFNVFFEAAGDPEPRLREAFVDRIVSWHLVPRGSRL